MRAVKLDSCSAIYLAKSGILDLAGELHGKVIITEAVHREAVLRGKEGGYADAYVIEQAIANGRIQVVQMGSSEREAIRSMPMLEKLGRGEAETLYEALVQGCPAMVDDRDARIAAQALGIEHTSSVALLIEAVFKASMDLSSFDEALERLASAAGIPPDRIREARRMARMYGGV